MPNTLGQINSAGKGSKLQTVAKTKDIVVVVQENITGDEVNDAKYCKKPFYSILSLCSILSLISMCSILGFLSLLSVGSLMSTMSAFSILSTSSLGSILSTNSILSINCNGQILHIC